MAAAYVSLCGQGWPIVSYLPPMMMAQHQATIIPMMHSTTELTSWRGWSSWPNKAILEQAIVGMTEEKQSTHSYNQLRTNRRCSLWCIIWMCSCKPTAVESSNILVICQDKNQRGRSLLHFNKAKQSLFLVWCHLNYNTNLLNVWQCQFLLLKTTCLYLMYNFSLLIVDASDEFPWDMTLMSLCT